MGAFPEMMSLKTILTAVSGQPHVPMLAGAILVYILVFAIGLVLQRFLKAVLPSSLYSYAADFSFTMVVCAYPYSHNTVRSLHGHIGFIVAAVLALTFTAKFFDGIPSPLIVFQNYLKGKESMVGFGVRVLLQTLAAFLSYQLVYRIWSLEVTREHQKLLLASACESDLRVPIVLGFLVEFSAVMYDTWLSKQQLFKSTLVDTIVKNTNAAVLVCAGIHMTGMYMHPALASAMSWNCKGTKAFEHIVVYWIAAFCGCYAGGELHAVFHLPSSTPSPSGDGKVEMDQDNKNQAFSGDGFSSSSNSNNNVKQRKKTNAPRKAVEQN